MLTRLHERTGHQAAIYALCLAPGGFFTAAADGYLVRWQADDAELGKVVAQVEGGKFLCLTTLEGGGLVAGALDGGVHWLYPGAEERNLHIAQHRRGVFAICRIGEEVFTGGGDGILTRWNAHTGRTLESLPLSANSLRCIAHFPAANALLVGASDGRIYTVSLPDFTLVHTVPANEPSVFAVVPLPPRLGPGYISGGRDARLRVFGYPAGKEIQLPPVTDAHLSTVNAMAFDPTGQFLATASRDKTVKLWKADTLELLKVCEVVRDRGHVNSVNTLLWLDEKHLLTAGDDRRILEWRLND